MSETGPRVSVVIPCLNEAGTIGGTLEALRHQSPPAAGFEVLVVDGGSTDGTRSIVRDFAERHPEPQVRIVPNPERNIPAALNRGVAAARGSVVIRLDAHSEPAADYIERCLDTLARTEAANVGGRWQIEPGGPGWQARSIAAAAAHPLGAGDARYRVSGGEGPVDTVPFGAFPRAWLDRIGPFNESLLSNEDYEYNVRIRQAGGVVWFNPSIKSTYFARSSFRSLARQYARYGFWKARMLLRFPRTLRWRQLLPPLFVLVALGLAVVAVLWPLATPLLALQWGGYALALLAAGLGAAVDEREPTLFVGLPVALALMHLSWGTSFWVGLLSGWIGGGRAHEEK